MSSYPETATFAEFARIAGFRASYITQLKGEGRLVLTADGKQVRVAESMQSIDDTKNPDKIGVARRHAAERLQAAHAAAAAEEADVGAHVAPSGPTAPDPETERATSGFQQARTVRERYAAMQAKRDYEISMGKLLDAGEVVASVANAATVLRSRLEGLPDVLAPQLVVVTDEAKVRSILREAIGHALDELTRQFEVIGKRAA